MDDSSAIREFNTAEQRIIKIKSDIDQFDELLKMVANGFGDTKYLNNQYHDLILSTKDLSSHLSTIQKTIEVGSHIPDLRARARNLNTQAISQLRRLQKLGVDVQQYVRNGSKAYSVNYQGPYPPLSNFSIDQPSEQKQVTLESKGDVQRAHEMEQLESDIVQVNELFTIIATYIHDQGTLVDSIGDNIEVAYEQVCILQFAFIMSFYLRIITIGFLLCL
ncbi:Syntaxin-12 isoform 1 [Schistosoma japonicum]|uniref:Syntaxin-12 isoform 1 n=1 Tax=Schistosoma japonicum TaxID=6182 RepID=A0A4Z2DJX9_SCHJA|nr:Syntaxin-12 [Schistosoma japonicum]KAH8858571.1 Syntaxin-12 [Schistosoma japonicum]TNN16772.1 Syntaxin-12 isoform 1 [Schistosoma japonicum]